jgi:hypothetical protein
MATTDETGTTELRELGESDAELHRTDHSHILREGDPPLDNPEQQGSRLIERVAEESGEISEKDQQEAIDFLLAAFHETLPEASFQDRLLVNVGTPRKPKRILWVIRALSRPEIRRIEESVANSREVQQGRNASPDLRYQTSVRIVVAGTVSPPLNDLAINIGLVSGIDFLEEALKMKSGLIEQLAGEIYGISGYDQSDLTDATEVKAAGN